MSGLLFALLAACLAGLAGRDQLLVAAVAKGNGRHRAILSIALASALATAAIAALLPQLALPAMGPVQRQMFAALALAAAGLELLFSRRRAVPREPTHSLGAFALVLFAVQLFDPARLVVVAVAVGTAAPVPAGIGGMLGGAGLVLAGWLGADWLLARDLVPLRRGLGLVLLVAAAVVALLAR